jgi:trans-2,3-dihydro-3-hydroxyanthranilate isomerase
MEQRVPVWQPFRTPEKLLAVLGAEGSGLPVEVYPNGPRHAYVELGSAGEVAALRPDFGALAQLTSDCVNCFARDGETWKLRMFAPREGVPEDAATGSAAGPLAVHLARHGRVAFGEELEIVQGVEIGRPSRLFAVAEGSEDRIDAVRVGGSAVIVSRGEFRIP